METTESIQKALLYNLGCKISCTNKKKCSRAEIKVINCAAVYLQ